MSEADLALSHHPHYVNGKQVDPKKAIPREDMMHHNLLNGHHPASSATDVTVGGVHGDEQFVYTHRPSQWDHQKLYVRGLCVDRAAAKENYLLDEMRRAFSQFGNVQQVEISLNPRRLPFVILDSVSAVERAVVHSVGGK